MKRAFETISLLLVLTSFVNAQHVFKINITIPKTTYIVGEPVQIGISVVNISGTTIHQTPLGFTGLRVIDENGKEVQRGGVAGNWWSPLKNQLEPNEEDYRVIELNEYFGKPYGSLLMVEQYFDVGRYTVRAIFYPRNQSFQAESTQVSFQVIKPEGDELAAYNDFLEIMKNDKEHRYTDVELAETIKSLHEAHPNSVYSPYFLENLDAIYDIPLGEHSKALEARKELVEKYPWSVHAPAMLDGILRTMKSDSDRIEYLEKLQASSKGTLMEKIYVKKIQTESAKGLIQK
ncbi:MAG: hypothetical protein M1470_00105 [Bacteroidetes bacterium]|nr:hypothetical protein [Bacteroidota bacterium]